MTARLEPATIDKLVYGSSMVVLYVARHQLPVPRLARWLLTLGIVATLAANMARGWSHGPARPPAGDSPVVSYQGTDYVVLQNVNGVLAVYEIREWDIWDEGQAEVVRLAKWPTAIEEW
jgi:hypothetical protein